VWPDRWHRRFQIALLSTGGLIQEGLHYADVAGHSNSSVNLERLAKQRSRFFAIPWGSAID
jgi:hypothetical protein